MPTPKQIQDEIKQLRTMKPTVVRTSFFGDNHWDAIEAQIRVLNGDVDEDNFDEEFEEERDNVRDCAQQALDWMTGYVNEKPSDDWQSLVR